MTAEDRLFKGLIDAIDIAAQVTTLPTQTVVAKEESGSMRDMIRSLRPAMPYLVMMLARLSVLIPLIVASSTYSYALGVGQFSSLDNRDVLGGVGVAVVVIVLIVFRKLIAKLVRLLFGFLLDLLFTGLSVSAILFAAAVISNYGINKASASSGPPSQVFQYVATALFIVAILAGVVMFIRAIAKFFNGLRAEDSKHD